MLIKKILLQFCVLVIITTVYNNNESQAGRYDDAAQMLLEAFNKAAKSDPPPVTRHFNDSTGAKNGNHLDSYSPTPENSTTPMYSPSSKPPPEPAKELNEIFNESAVN